MRFHARDGANWRLRVDQAPSVPNKWISPDAGYRNPQKSSGFFRIHGQMYQKSARPVTTNLLDSCITVISARSAQGGGRETARQGDSGGMTNERMTNGRPRSRRRGEPRRYKMRASRTASDPSTLQCPAWAGNRRASGSRGFPCSAARSCLQMLVHGVGRGFLKGGADHHGRHANHRRVGRHIVQHHAARADLRPLADGYPPEHLRPGP